MILTITFSILCAILVVCAVVNFAFERDEKSNYCTIAALACIVIGGITAKIEYTYKYKYDYHLSLERQGTWIINDNDEYIGYVPVTDTCRFNIILNSQP